MLFYKDFVMNIVVKIKQCLLVTFVLSNTQLIAMNKIGTMHLVSMNNEEFAKKCSHSLNHLYMQIHRYKVKLAEESQSFFQAEALLQNIIVSVNNYYGEIYQINLRKGSMSEFERNKIRDQINENYRIYQSLFVGQMNLVDALQEKIKITENILRVCEGHVYKLDMIIQKQYALQNNEQRGQKRKLETDNNTRESKRKKLNGKK